MASEKTHDDDTKKEPVDEGVDKDEVKDEEKTTDKEGDVSEDKTMAEDENMARALSLQLQEEIALQETRDAEFAQELAYDATEEAVPEEIVVLQTNVHCVSAVEMPSKGLFDGTPSVRVAVAVASGGELVATDTTDLVKVDPGSKTASWGRDAIQITLQKSVLAAPTTLCFTLYLSYDNSDRNCCIDYCAPFTLTVGDATPLAATGLLPVSSKDGSPADWIDSAPRDHFLDDGAVLTVSSTIILPKTTHASESTPPEETPVLEKTKPLEDAPAPAVAPSDPALLD